MGGVGGVEVYDVLPAVLWDGLQQLEACVPVRLDQADAVALIDVIKGHVKE